MQEYEWGLAQYMGAGVAACYRGLRLFDTEETKALVKKWVHFYKVRLTTDIANKWLWGSRVGSGAVQGD